MYIKISKLSQLVTLRNINLFFKKRKTPKEVLYDLQKILFSDDNFYTIAVKGKKKLVWSCCEIEVKSEMRIVYAVYPMRKRDIFGESDY